MLPYKKSSRAMTIKNLIEIIKANNIQDDVTIESDSEWECDSSEVNLIYYNRENGILVLCGEGTLDKKLYESDQRWEKIYEKQ